MNLAAKNQLDPLSRLSPSAREVAEAMKEVGGLYDDLRRHLISLVSNDTISEAAADPDFPVVKAALSVDRPSVLVPRLKIALDPASAEVSADILQAQHILKELLLEKVKPESVLTRYVAIRPANRALITPEYEEWLVKSQMVFEDVAHEKNVHLNKGLCTRNYIIFDFYRACDTTREEANLHYDESLGLYAIRTLGELREIESLSREMRPNRRVLGSLGKHWCALNGHSEEKEFIYNRGISIFHDCQVGAYSQDLLTHKAFDLTRVLLISDLLKVFNLPFVPELILKEKGLSFNPRPSDPLATTGIVGRLIQIARVFRGQEVSVEEMKKIFAGEDPKRTFRVRSVVNAVPPQLSALVVPVKASVSTAVAPLSKTEEFNALVDELDRELALPPGEKAGLLSLSKLYARKGIISKQSGEGVISLDYLCEMVRGRATYEEIRGVVEQCVAYRRSLERKYLVESNAPEVRSPTSDSTHVVKERVVQVQYVLTMDEAVDKWLNDQDKVDRKRANLVRQTVHRLSTFRPRDESPLVGLRLDGVFRCHIPGANELRLIYRRKGQEIRVLQVVFRRNYKNELRLLRKRSELRRK